MRKIEEMSISETMEALKISESNVKALLSRAKEMLREKLSGKKVSFLEDALEKAKASGYGFTSDFFISKIDKFFSKELQVVI